MKRFFILFLTASLVFLSSCGNNTAEDEEFSADFTIREDLYSPTSVVLNPDSTEVFLSHPEKDNSELPEFIASCVFSDNSDTLLMPDDELKVFLAPGFTKDDISELEKITSTLNSIPSFPGIREVTRDDANVTVRFSDSRSFNCNADSYGRITDAEISIPYSVSPSERSALLCEYLMRVCGFQYRSDSSFDSVISKNCKADFFTDEDLTMLDILFSVGCPGMKKDEFISQSMNYHN